MKTAEDKMKKRESLEIAERKLHKSQMKASKLEKKLRKIKKNNGSEEAIKEVKGELEEIFVKMHQRYKKVEKTISFNNSINDTNLDNFNNIFQQKNSNNNINNYQNNNILIPNISQQMDDYAPLKYNNNLGINNINTSNQISFISLNNNLMNDLNNLLNNSFPKNNLSQLLNQDLKYNFDDKPS